MIKITMIKRKYFYKIVFVKQKKLPIFALAIINID